MAGQFLPVDADGGMTVRELLQRRDGGPLEARYGRLRDRVLAAGINGLSLGSRPSRTSPATTCAACCSAAHPSTGPSSAWRALPERRERLLARGGDAFALAEALRADPAAPGALVVLEPALLAIADDCGADEQARRREPRGALRARQQGQSSRSSTSPAGWPCAQACRRAPCA